MKTSITNISPTDTTFTVNLDESQLGLLKKQALDKLRAQVKVAGFRPGKAPDHIVEREIGDASLQSEVIDAAISESYANAVKEHNLEVIASPQVNITKFVPFSELEYSATVDIMPEVKLADYKHMKKPLPEIKVEEAEVDATLSDLAKKLAEKTEVNRAAKTGDELTIDFEGEKDGKMVEGAKANNHQLLLGSNTFIPGFEQQLEGLKAGETKSFLLTFPADYQAADLAGQEVTFKVTVHKISELKMPELDQKFVESISPFRTLDELKQDIIERIKAEKTEQTMATYESEVVDEVVDKSTWSASDRLVEAQITRMKNELEERLASSGLDLEKYLGLSNKSMLEIEAEMRPTAKKRVGTALVLNRIAKAENITVEHDEIHQEIDRLKATYSDPQMQAELDTPAVHDDVYNHLLASRTVSKILEYVSAAAKS
ncbi:MAG: trigger factor [Candidatus Saccharimonadia bacterium]